MDHRLTVKIVLSRNEPRGVVLLSQWKNMLIEHHIPGHIFFSLKIINFPLFLPMWILEKNAFMGVSIKLIQHLGMIIDIT